MPLQTSSKEGPIEIAWILKHTDATAIGRVVYEYRQQAQAIVKQRSSARRLQSHCQATHQARRANGSRCLQKWTMLLPVQLHKRIIENGFNHFKIFTSPSKCLVYDVESCCILGEHVYCVSVHGIVAAAIFPARQFLAYKQLTIPANSIHADAPSTCTYRTQMH